MLEGGCRGDGSASDGFCSQFTCRHVCIKVILPSKMLWWVPQRSPTGDKFASSLVRAMPP